jgi:hypothetical protein
MGLSKIDQIAAPASRSLGPYPHARGDFMPITRKKLYPHRHNYDGSFDSICRTCYATVGHASDEAMLAELEKTHSCDLRLLAEWKILLSEAKETGIHLVPRPVDMAPYTEPAEAGETSREMQKPDM